MTENAYSNVRDDRQLWGVNNLVEFGRDADVDDLIEEFHAEEAEFGVADDLVLDLRTAC